MVRYIGIMLSALISSCDAKALLGWSLSDKTYFWREGEKSSQSWNTNNTHTHTHVDVLSAWRLKNTLQGGGGGVCRGVRWNARITQLLVCLLSDWVFLCAVVWTCRFTAGCLSCCSASEHDGAKKKKKMCDWLHFNKLQRQRTLCQHIYFRIHPYGNQPKWHYFDAGQNNVPTERFAKSKTGVTDLCKGDHRKVFSAAAIINIWLWLTITLKDKCVAFLD